MIRTFTQILRSGALGRKSMGTQVARLVREWLYRQTPASLFRASVGNDPSLADVMWLCRYKPRTDEERALGAYIMGKTRDANPELLPDFVKEFEAWKKEQFELAGGEHIPDKDPNWKYWYQPSLEARK